jgi:membrane protease YdiL (CAAX protease family)
MTIGHRLTVAYAIIVTSLVFGFCHGNRHLLALEEKRPDLTLTQANRNHLSVRFTVPYFFGGIMLAAIFLFNTRSEVKRKDKRNAQQSSQPYR